MTTKTQIAIIFAALVLGGAALAKLPPMSDEAKAKAAEAAAKTAHTGKVDNYLLCKSQEKSAASFYKTAKTAGKEAKPAVETPACVDPGPYVAAPAPVAVAAALPSASAAAKPLEAAGAHSPTTMAASPPNSSKTAATMNAPGAPATAPAASAAKKP